MTCLFIVRKVYLFRRCNQSKSVWAIVRTLYAALYFEFFTRWIREGLTIARSGFLLKGAFH